MPITDEKGNLGLTVRKHQCNQPLPSRNMKVKEKAGEGTEVEEP